jgi:hypothetical protein
MGCRFGHATMPISNLFKNCSYYYGFAAYVVSAGAWQDGVRCCQRAAPAYHNACWKESGWRRGGCLLLVTLPPPTPPPGAMQAYFVNHPLFTAPNETLSIVCFVLAILCQYTNYR